MQARSWTLPHSSWGDDVAFPEEALLLMERADEVLLARVGDAVVKNGVRGHCFTADWHLHWRRLGARVRLVGMGEVPGASGWGEPQSAQDLGAYDAEENRVVLWGRREPEETMWLELRIPNLMVPPRQHPADHGPESLDRSLRRFLRVVTYRDATGRACFHRYAGVGYAAVDPEDSTFDVLDHPHL
jgi:hypothetical protein